METLWETPGGSASRDSTLWSLKFCGDRSDFLTAFHIAGPGQLANLHSSYLLPNDLHVGDQHFTLVHWHFWWHTFPRFFSTHMLFRNRYGGAAFPEQVHESVVFSLERGHVAPVLQRWFWLERTKALLLQSKSGNSQRNSEIAALQ